MSIKIDELKEVRNDLIKGFKFLSNIDISYEERKKEAEILKTASSLAKQIINSYDIEIRVNKLGSE